MKYNQYAYVETDFNTQVKELINIKFLPSNYQTLSFTDLLKVMSENAIAEVAPDAEDARQAKLTEFAVSSEQTLADFLTQQPEQETATQFYNVALQLLGYHVHYDYDLDDPLKLMKKQALPFLTMFENPESNHPCFQT